MLTDICRSLNIATLSGYSSTILIKNYAGVETQLSASYHSTWINAINSTWGGSSQYRSIFYFGTGDNLEDGTSYCLQNEITMDNYTIAGANKGILSSLDDLKASLSATVSWKGSKTTIKEIGIFCGWSDTNRYLFVREVLESPITVNTGDIFTVSTVIG